MKTDPLRTLKGAPYFVMDGAGNDFVIADLRGGGAMTAEAAMALGDRAGAFGCDQVIAILEGPAMAIWNADGSEAGACGNAARCVASVLFAEEEGDSITFGSPSGPLRAAQRGTRVEVDMGPPRLRWDEIPLAGAVDDTLSVPLDGLEALGLEPPTVVSMGNPHAVFFVPDADTAELTSFGPVIEHHGAFPDRANVTVATVREGGLRIRTWERGVGITRACGTAACASVVAGVRRGLLGRKAEVIADGGTLDIHWDEASGHVLMAGPVRLQRTGQF